MIKICHVNVSYLVPGGVVQFLRRPITSFKITFWGWGRNLFGLQENIVYRISQDFYSK